MLLQNAPARRPICAAGGKTRPLHQFQIPVRPPVTAGGHGEGDLRVHTAQVRGDADMAVDPLFIRV